MRRLNYSLPMLLILILVFAFSGCTQSGNDVTQPDVDTEEKQSAESTTGLPTQDTTESTTEEESSEAPDSNEPVPRDISVAQDKSLLAYLIPNEDSEISTDTYTLEIKGSGEMGSLSYGSIREKITQVILPDGLTSISESAFNGFSALKHITIPDTVTEIGSSAFMYCTSLESITLPRNLTKLPDQIFQNCTVLKEIVIPDSVTTIGSFAFAWCESLESVSLPASLTLIDEFAFNSCISLTSVSSMQGLTELRRGAFSNCKALTEIEIPTSVQTIGHDVFEKCTSLQMLTIPFLGASREDNSSAELKYLFDHSATLSQPRFAPETIVITEGTHIPENAFAYCTMKYVVLPDTIESIGASAFYSCSNLVSIDIPDGVDILPSCVFASCSRLEEVKLPHALAYIDESAFSHCTSLMTLTLPENVSEIHYAAFTGCEKLVEILNNSLLLSTEQIYDADLNGITPEKVLIHSGTDSLWETYDGLVYFNGLLVDYCGTASEITVAATQIGNYTFAYNEFLTSITLTQDVQSIGQGIFYGCPNLQSVTIEGEITKLPEGAFSMCSMLSEINLPDTIKSIDPYVFNGTAFFNAEENWDGGVLYCGNYMLAVRGGLTELIVREGTTLIANNAISALPFANASSTIEAIVLPESLKYIGNNALNYTDITEIVIPKAVESIGSGAFHESHELQTITLAANPAFGTLNNFFNLSDIKTVIITQGTEIYDYMFAGLKFSDNCVLTIQAPSNLTVIGKYAFSGISGATSVVLPDSITEIHTSAFQNCESLTAVKLPASLRKIGDHAFDGCKGIAEISIPDGVTEIGRCAFIFCSKLETIHFSGNLEKIGNGIFSSTAYAQNPDNWIDHVLYFGQYAIGADNESMSYTIKDGTTVLCDSLFNNDDCRQYTLPGSLKYIGESVFPYRTGTLKFHGTQEQWDAVTKADHWISENADYKIELLSSR